MAPRRAEISRDGSLVRRVSNKVERIRGTLLTLATMARRRQPASCSATSAKSCSLTTPSTCPSSNRRTVARRLGWVFRFNAQFAARRIRRGGRFNGFNDSYGDRQTCVGKCALQPHTNGGSRARQTWRCPMSALADRISENIVASLVH